MFSLYFFFVFVDLCNVKGKCRHFTFVFQFLNLIILYAFIHQKEEWNAPIECLRDDVSKEEPYAWETREFLRKKLIGQEVTVWTQGDNSADRIFGNIFFPKDKNITEELVENGLVTVRSGNMRSPSVDLQTLMELEKKAKTEGKGKWAPNAKVKRIFLIHNPLIMWRCTFPLLKFLVLFSLKNYMVHKL